MKIRKATEKDVSDVVNIIQSSYKFSYRGYLPDDYLDDLCVTDDVLLKWNKYIKNYECYVAVKQKSPIAFLMLDDNKTENFEVCVLYVAPDYQKIGIGSSLLNHVFEIMKNKGYKECFVWTMKDGPSIGFYSNRGFKITGDEKAWKFDIPIVKMIKKI